MQQVFQLLRSESQTDVMQDWVMLSLSTFAQLDPLPLAAWSLTSFLLSASSNLWTRALSVCLFPSF